MKQLKTYDEHKKHIFVIIKPGFLHLCSKILNIFEKHRWGISMLKTKQLLPSEARSLYKIHKNEKFYNPLCKYMSSGLSMAFIFSKDLPMSDHVVKEVDKIKDEIRQRWGESEMRNVIHSSDSLEHMNDEAKIYFHI